ncbi:MAG TPA: ferrochelatase [Opitutaceae bacterium]|jgi:ferrochelatase
MPKRAVLLVNLGSPDSTDIPDVRRYLKEFLGDSRVLDMPKAMRWLLLEGLILRTRPKRTSHAYSKVWTPEGSPLIVTSERVRDKVTAALGGRVPIYLGMRYGKPAVADLMRRISGDGIEELLLIPQYPHYAMSSWETAVVQVYAEGAKHAPNVRITLVQPFYDAPDYIAALAAVTAPGLAEPFDHVLFSYHGIPERHLRQTDPSHSHCLTVRDCCDTCSPAHATCYRAQCFATTRALAAKLQLPEGKYSVSFQSRLGSEPWLRPFTDLELERLPQTGVKRLAVLCPAFVADCLETLEEIRMAGQETFLEAGGESFRQIPCPNDQPPYIDFLVGRIKRWMESN